MSKSRFSTSDTQAMVRDIRSSVMGQRLANVYDLNDKTYLFKFATPGQTEKIILLLESGIRFHTTKYARDKNDLPSPFAMKLRKYVRTKRLEDVSQLGGDRVVDFKFGSAEVCNHIILELYANGNIVLTDSGYEILALLRSHQFDDDVAMKVGEIYPMTQATAMDTSQTSIQGSMLSMDFQSFVAFGKSKHEEARLHSERDKKSKGKKYMMRQLLLAKESGVGSFGGEILDHSLLLSDIKPSMRVDQIDQLQPAQFARLQEELRKGQALLNSLNIPGQPGYILFQEGEMGSASASSGSGEGAAVGAHAAGGKLYAEFVPRRFKQHESKAFVEFPSFDEAVDEYYCKVEEQKLQKQANSAEEESRKKIAKVRADHEGRLKSLSQQQRRMERGAMLVQAFADDVDKACLVINSALGAGMAWEDIDDMVKTETAAGNSIASLVKELRLERNRIVLRLPDLFAGDDEDDERAEGHDDGNGDGEGDEGVATSEKSKGKGKAKDKSKGKGQEHASASKPKPVEKSEPFVDVDLDLALSAHANAGQMFTHKKVAHAKEAKTVEASERAVLTVEAQVTKALEAQKMARSLKAIRKVHWFEKFNWFISSEGYLVLSGRDAQQNEMLVKRYLRPGDAYVHAEINGASSCIVRCKQPATAEQPVAAPISALALQEAGCMTVCRSGAWGNKVITSAWWVHADQVSKKAPTGEYLSTGSFMIYGRKNFLPPSNLEMGFGIMFRLADASVARHLNDRVDRAMQEDAESVMTEAFERYGMEFDLREDGAPEQQELEIVLEGDEEVDVDGDEGPRGDDGVHEEQNDSDDNNGDDGDVDEGNQVLEQDDNEDSVGSPEEHDVVDDIRVDLAATLHLDDTDEVFGHDNVGDCAATATETPLVEENEGLNHDEAEDGQAVIGGKMTAKERKLMKKMKKKGEVVDPKSVRLMVASSKSAAAATSSLQNEVVEDDADRDVDEEDDDDLIESEREMQSKVLKGKLESNESTSMKGAKGGKDSKAPSAKVDVKGSAKASAKQAIAPVPSAAPSPAAAGVKKLSKAVNKKKARRYAEQDEEERELAMRALGHVKPGEVRGAEEKTADDAARARDRAKKQQKAGIKFEKADWESTLAQLSPALAASLQEVVSAGLMKEGELDAFEVKSLSLLPEDDAIAVVKLFVEGNREKRIGNKSGFLAGIMRRFSRERDAKSQKRDEEDHTASLVPSDLNGGEDESISGDQQGATTLSRRERKKLEQQEIQEILEDEGVLDENEGKIADEIEKITGMPLADDQLMFAVPVCGPYAAMQKFKYRVKLTPGTGKKGKTCKQALEVFTRGRDCNATEKGLIRGLTDPEMVAIMIGDVKLSVPGLQQVKQLKKKQVKAGKKGQQ